MSVRAAVVAVTVVLDAVAEICTLSVIVVEVTAAPTLALTSALAVVLVVVPAATTADVEEEEEDMDDDPSVVRAQVQKFSLNFKLSRC
jgi:hypothetical protein